MGVRCETCGTHAVSGGRIYGYFGVGVEVTGSVNATVGGCEIFGNLSYGLRSSSSNAIDATGNWWGAVDGPGGSEPGSGDEVTGNVTTTGFLTDGTEFSYFNAGGTDHYGYGIGQPNVTGIPSVEWGGSAIFSFLYNIDEHKITADYVGLQLRRHTRCLLPI